MNGFPLHAASYMTNGATNGTAPLSEMAPFHNSAYSVHGKIDEALCRHFALLSYRPHLNGIYLYPVICVLGTSYLISISLLVIHLLTLLLYL